MHRVDLWYWRLDAPGHDDWTTLSADEVARAKDRPRGKVQDQYVSARAGLRRTLMEHLGAGRQPLVFVCNEFGKPRLACAPTLHFSLTHAGELAALALSDSLELGVDIEQVAPIEHIDIARRHFSSAEFDSLLGKPKSEQLRAFYTIWTMKEAVVKALGTGLSTRLDSFQVSSDPAQLTSCPADWGEPNQWFVMLPAPCLDYSCALAARAGDKSVTVRERWR